MGKNYLDEDFALKPTFGDLVQIHNFFGKIQNILSSF